MVPHYLIFGTIVRNKFANNISSYTDVCVTSITKINKTMDSSHRSNGSANSICTDNLVIDRSTFYHSIAVEGSVTKVQDPCDDGHWILMDSNWLCGDRNRAQPVTYNKPNSHIPQCTIPYPTMHHSFLSWMVYCWVWKRWIVGFVRFFYCLSCTLWPSGWGLTIREFKKCGRP